MRRLASWIIGHFYVPENGERERRLKEIEEAQERERAVRRRAVRLQQDVMARRPPSS